MEFSRFLHVAHDAIILVMEIQLHDNCIGHIVSTQNISARLELNWS